MDIKVKHKLENLKKIKCWKEWENSFWGELLTVGKSTSDNWIPQNKDWRSKKSTL